MTPDEMRGIARTLVELADEYGDDNDILSTRQRELIEIARTAAEAPAPPQYCTFIRDWRSDFDGFSPAVIVVELDPAQPDPVADASARALAAGEQAFTDDTDGIPFAEATYPYMILHLDLRQDPKAETVFVPLVVA